MPKILILPTSDDFSRTWFDVPDNILDGCAEYDFGLRVDLSECVEVYKKLNRIVYNQIDWITKAHELFKKHDISLEIDTSIKPSNQNIGKEG